MKLFKRIAAIVLAATLVLAMGMTAMAGETPNTGDASAAGASTGSITITPPEGVQDGVENTYKIYKVFDAAGNGESISYKLVAGKETLPDGFELDAGGNVIYSANKGKEPGDSGYVTELTAADIAAIAAYVSEDDLVATATASGTDPAVASGLPNGFYYITTSTGSVVTIDSTNPNAEVIDKNSVPELDKVISDTDWLEDGIPGTITDSGKKALAELGREVQYTATITVGKGAINYVFHDKMATGLTFKSGSVSVSADPAIEGTSWYTVIENPSDGDTVDVEFADGIAEDTVITITYIGKVNTDALTIDNNQNTAYVKYGDSNHNNKTPDSTTNVYNARLNVLKSDGKGQPLAGAGFVIVNENGSYYATTGDPNPTSISWVTEEEASEHLSGDDGVVPPFTGLVDGTYTLVEKTVPSGYNKAADLTFTIASGDYTEANLVINTSVINNSGQELPSTGGIGTTIFYVIGAILVLGSGVILVSKRRMAR